MDTPLKNEHLKLNARMISFGGWDMPLQYSGIIKEHKHCREKVCIFDTCHMGEFYFKGDYEKSGLQKLFCFPLDKIKPGKCRYGFMLNENGGVIDDLIVYKIADNEFMFVVNASTTLTDFEHITENIEVSGGNFSDISQLMGKIDIQGPLSREILEKTIGREISDIPYFGFKYLKVLNKEALISRTGYTGELGYEIYIPVNKVVELWQLLAEVPDVIPAGLGARDTLRLEIGYSLYGNDLDKDTTPLEAGLEYFVDLNIDFIGKESLLEQKKKGFTKIKTALKTGSRRTPRSNNEIVKDGKVIGTVTSGSFSPSLSCGIGLGFIKPEFSEPGTKIIVDNSGKQLDAVITELPFYKEGTARK